MTLTVKEETATIKPSNGTEIVGVRSVKTEIVDGQLVITVAVELNSKADSNKIDD